MRTIEVHIDAQSGKAYIRGNLYGTDGARFVLKGFAQHATATCHIGVMLGDCEVAGEDGFSVDGDDAVVSVSTDTERVRRIAESTFRPVQAGVSVSISDPESNMVPVSGRTMLLLNWDDRCAPGGGGQQESGDYVRITNLGELPSRYRESDLRDKVNELVRVIGGRAVVIAALSAPFALFGAGVSVSSARMDEIWNDQSVVTNVTFDQSGLVTSLADATNYTDAAVASAVDAASAVIRDVSASATNYTDAAKAALAADISSARIGAVSDAKAYTDAATNAIVVPAYDLEPYARKTWVEAKGYLVQSALSDYATKEWVGGLGLVDQEQIADYATREWVGGQGYLVDADLSQYAKTSWVESQNYATRTWVESHGFIGQQALSPYATMSWVTAGFAGSAALDALSLKIEGLSRQYADTNAVNRLWSEDGLTMTDATGVVWDVSWTFRTNWTSLSNGLVYVQKTGSTWESEGVVTNMSGDVGVGVIEADMGMQGQFGFYVKTVRDEADANFADGLSLVFGESYNMPADAFTGAVVRASVLAYRNRFAYITEAGGGGAKPFIGQTFDFSDNRVLYTALSNIVIQLGGTVVNFPVFQ